MIASLSAIVYIVSITDERYSEKNVQYLEIIDTKDGYQIYKFTAYANSDNDLIDLDNNLYKVTNLTPAKDNSFNVTITTSIRLPYRRRTCTHLKTNRPFNR